MNKILLVLKREYVARVKKKSFLLVTILVPILFPTLIGAVVYFAIQDQKSEQPKVINYYDPENLVDFDDSYKFSFEEVEGDSLERNKAFMESGHYGLLEMRSNSYTLFTLKSPSISEMNSLEETIESELREKSIRQLNLTPEMVSSLKPSIELNAFSLIEGKESDSGIAFAIGYAGGFLIYMFIFIYGAQVMQGVIEEKSSKIVEILISTVRPFQLMMGKVLGIAAVGFTQFLIWIVLFAVITSALTGYFGLSGDEMETAAQGNQALQIVNKITSLPIAEILFIFGFYFIGGYLLYGSLFAAVGSAVDSPSEAQQFMFPITIPLIISIIGLSIALENPDGNFSFWLSIIPLTSPVVMMGRIGFGMPPAFELITSMVLLILGFVFTIWLAGRIYRIGILMHGTKVNYKVLAKWLMMKN